MNAVIRNGILLCLFAMVTACGFHLRGSYSLPAEMAVTFVQYSGTNTGIRQSIVRALILNDVQIVSSPEAAEGILQIRSASTQSSIISRSNEGRPLEYSVSVTLVFRLVKPDGYVIFDTQSVSADTVVVLDTVTPGASGSEMRSVAQGLQEEAIWKMVRVLSTSTRLGPDEQPLPEPAPETE